MKPSQKAFAIWFYLVASTLSFVVFFGLVAQEAYTRWSVNQNFTYLGGDGLAALAILTLGLMLGLAYLARHDK